jgi:hypothetical protein
MDYFGFDANGHIVEHQDAVLAVPPQTQYGNPMY